MCLSLTTHSHYTLSLHTSLHTSRLHTSLHTSRLHTSHYTPLEGPNRLSLTQCIYHARCPRWVTCMPTERPAAMLPIMSVPLPLACCTHVGMPKPLAARAVALVTLTHADMVSRCLSAAEIESASTSSSCSNLSRSSEEASSETVRGDSSPESFFSGAMRGRGLRYLWTQEPMRDGRWCEGKEAR